MCVINKLCYWKELKRTSLFTQDHYKQTGDSRHDFLDSFLPRVTCGAQIDQYIPARITLEESRTVEGSQTVSAYPNFTPIILKPKTPSYNRSFLSVRASLRVCWWYWYREKRKRLKGKEAKREYARCPSSRDLKKGIWQIASRQNFRASIFHVGRKA